MHTTVHASITKWLLLLFTATIGRVDMRGYLDLDLDFP
jgi:hypothetical protein